MVPSKEMSELGYLYIYAITLKKRASGGMASLKDQGTALGQRKPNRDDVIQEGGAGPSSRGPTIGSKEDDGEDIGEQRQAQAMRAMWARRCALLRSNRNLMRS